MAYTRTKMELIRFFSMLYLPTNGGYVEIRPIDADGRPNLDKRSWVPTTNQEEFADKVLELRDQYNVYFGTVTRKKKGKGTAQYLKELPALWADLDGKDYDGGISEARQRIESTRIPPSYVNFSGHGFHCWWLLTKPYDLDHGHSRPTALLKALQVYELESDPTYDLPRLLRPPNSVNHKDEEPIKVKSLRMKPIRYSIKELAEELDWKKALEEGHEITEGNGIEEGKYDGIEKVLDSDFIRYCKENAKTLPEPLWYAQISNLLPFKNSRKYIHKLSKPYPSYSIQETKRKIQHCLKDCPGPHTAEFIREHGFDSKDCKEAGVKSPAGLAFVKNDNNGNSDTRARRDT